MPAQVATTNAANLQAQVQKTQSRALPRAQSNGDRHGNADAAKPEFRAMLERLQDKSRDEARAQAATAEARLATAPRFAPLRA